MANISGLFRSIYGGSLGNTAGAIDAARGQQALERDRLQAQLQAESMQSARTAALNELLMRGIDTGLGVWQKGAELQQQKEQQAAQRALQERELTLHENTQKRIAADSAYEKELKAYEQAAKAAAATMVGPSMKPQAAAQPRPTTPLLPPAPPPMVEKAPSMGPDAETMAAIGGKPIDQAELQATLDRMEKPTAAMRTAPREAGADMVDEMASARLAQLGATPPGAPAMPEAPTSSRQQPSDLSVSADEVQAYVDRFAKEHPDAAANRKTMDYVRGFFATALVEERRNLAAKSLENVANKQTVEKGARDLDNAAIVTTIKGNLGLLINDIKDIGGEQWNQVYSGIDDRLKDHNDTWASMTASEREALAKTLSIEAMMARKKAQSELANDATQRARLAQQMEADKKQADAIGSSEFKQWEIYLKGRKDAATFSQRAVNQIRGQLYDPTTGMTRVGITEEQRKELNSQLERAIIKASEDAAEHDRQYNAFATAVNVAQTTGIPLAPPQASDGAASEKPAQDSMAQEAKIKARAAEIVRNSRAEGKPVSTLDALKQAEQEME